MRCPGLKLGIRNKWKPAHLKFMSSANLPLPLGVFRSKRDNSWGLAIGEMIAEDNYCIGVLRGCRGKGDVEFIGCVASTIGRARPRFPAVPGTSWAIARLCSVAGVFVPAPSGQLAEA
jgi:hypothetical protein